MQRDAYNDFMLEKCEQRFLEPDPEPRCIYGFFIGDPIYVHNPGYSNHGLEGTVIGGDDDLVKVELLDGDYRFTTWMAPDHLRKADSRKYVTLPKNEVMPFEEGEC